MTTLAVGDRVRLRYAEVGDSGTVVTIARGKAQVHWQDLELTTRHALTSLTSEEVHTCDK
jgi:hypothetical protein